MCRTPKIHRIRTLLRCINNRYRWYMPANPHNQQTPWYIRTIKASCTLRIPFTQLHLFTRTNPITSTTLSAVRHLAHVHHHLLPFFADKYSTRPCLHPASPIWHKIWARWVWIRAISYPGYKNLSSQILRWISEAKHRLQKEINSVIRRLDPAIAVQKPVHRLWRWSPVTVRIKLVSFIDRHQRLRPRTVLIRETLSQHRLLCYGRYYSIFVFFKD